jgi:hypothetical protein
VNNEPEAGEIRFDDDDQVEVFDGARWRRYRDLPPEDQRTLFRDDEGWGTTR